MTALWATGMLIAGFIAGFGTLAAMIQYLRNEEGLDPAPWEN